MLLKTYDLIIVGAGPSGVSAAFFSKLYDKENEYNILLIEKLKENNYEVYHDMCGCCVSHSMFKEIRPIKPEFVVENIRFMEEYVADDFAIKHHIRGYILNRPAFLRNIVEKFISMGGKYLNATISEISHNKGNSSIKIKLNDGNVLETKFLIAADGANSRIRKQMGLNGIKTSVAIQYLTDEKPEKGTIKFYYDEKYGGNYKWHFPYGNLSKIGYLFPVNEKETMHGKIIKKQARVIACGRLEKYNFGNILFVGDAAGQTNILSKGGIRAGMYAGKLAAKSTIIYNDPDWYDKKWKKTGFYLSITPTTKAFERLEKMTNKELINHLQIFRRGSFFSTLLSFTRKYRKYRDLYKAYYLEQKYGW